jgi:hypothetical protein
MEAESAAPEGAIELAPDDDAVEISGKKADGESNEEPEELHPSGPRRRFDEVIDRVVQQEQAAAEVEDAVQPEHAGAAFAVHESGAKETSLAAAIKEVRVSHSGLFVESSHIRESQRDTQNSHLG